VKNIVFSEAKKTVDTSNRWYSRGIQPRLFKSLTIQG
jgi:hypothetical protein